MSDIPITPIVEQEKHGENHEPETCRCCGYPAKDIRAYPGPITGNGAREEGGSKFCGICAGTFLSHCVSYPQFYGSEKLPWSSIGWIANMLRDEIRTVFSTIDSRRG